MRVGTRRADRSHEGFPREWQRCSEILRKCVMGVVTLIVIYNLILYSRKYDFWIRYIVVLDGSSNFENDYFYTPITSIRK